jgi:hypothetical protein
VVGEVGPLCLASIEITRRCDNRCPYCDQPKEDLDMSPALFAALLDKLAADGVEAVALGGGEPTLHPALPALLEAARRRSLRAGLTTNGRDPIQVAALADVGLLHSFGVSAGKGQWRALVAHPHAIVNLLLLRGGLSQVMGWACQALRGGARCLLLLGYKGADAAFVPWAGVTVAADDYTRRRLGLAEMCGKGFLRVGLDGARDRCCFPNCEYREAEQ